jgi:hypothetical protein
MEQTPANNNNAKSVDVTKENVPRPAERKKGDKKDDKKRAGDLKTPKVSFCFLSSDYVVFLALELFDHQRISDRFYCKFREPVTMNPSTWLSESVCLQLLPNASNATVQLPSIPPFLN